MMAKSLPLLKRHPQLLFLDDLWWNDGGLQYVLSWYYDLDSSREGLRLDCLDWWEMMGSEGSPGHWITGVTRDTFTATQAAMYSASVDDRAIAIYLRDCQILLRWIRS
jgi:hypothetical protein